MKRLLNAALACVLCVCAAASAQDSNTNTAAGGAANAAAKKRGPVFRATKDQIKQAQDILRQRAFYAGESTGKLDPTTREGLKKYQGAEGLKVTGTLNAATLQMMNVALLSILTFALCPFTFALPSGGGGLFGEEALDYLVARLKSLAELLRLGAAALGHVGLAAAAPADDGREFLDDPARGDAPREVGRGAHDERSLAVGAASEDDHARLELREQRVGELAQRGGVEV